MRNDKAQIDVNINTRQIRVYGIVQGVGFRPTVSRHAAETGITGTVCNKGPYVEIIAQGTAEQVENFISALRQRPPRRAAILKIDEKQVTEQVVYPDFQIIESEKTKGAIYISPDIAICEECKEELYDPKDRRYLHPFINCTCCGPRLTILDALPYDRERTSMKEFPMCPSCSAEYYSPETRRYDAQPVCCNECGPGVYLLDPKTGDWFLEDKKAITEARKIVSQGGIIAIKGIGGFHLCCDATCEEAVVRLRTLKRRPMKPFAVMMRNEKIARQECEIEPLQQEILTGHQKPILLLKRRKNSQICPSVAPDNPKVGVMLPYAPLHLLLFDYDDGIKMPDILIMTSGNVSGAPICRDDQDALKELAHLCDGILSHDRLIRIRADDTVMDFFEGKPYMIRRSRGYAPLPFYLSNGWSGQVLGIGGELKNTFCISQGELLYPSPYVGDLADLRTVEALKETIHRFETLLEIEPEIVACDLHPKYNSGLVAEQLKKPLIRVQHHYAHILSCMAENDYLDPVIGVSMDGTGFGTDGTIWGGELLAADVKGFQRIGSIMPFLQIGGDLSAKEGWRIACSLIFDLIQDREKTLTIIDELGLCDAATAKVQITMAARKMNAVVSTSAGRLFDGISAILGIRNSSTFEGEASTALQFAAERYEERGISHLHSTVETDCIDGNVDERRIYMNTKRLVSEILEKRLQGCDPEQLAYEFHEKLARMIFEACRKAREFTGRTTVALSGGVFQNTLLLKLTVGQLREAGFNVLLHSMVPPNDGGIALGQALAALAELNRG